MAKLATRGERHMTRRPRQLDFGGAGSTRLVLCNSVEKFRRRLQRTFLQSNLTYDLYVDIFMAGTQGGPGALPAAEWPLCIDLGSQGVLSMDHSAGSSQNHSRAAGW